MEMIRLVDLRNVRSFSRFASPTRQISPSSVENVVRKIILRVGKQGDSALRFFARKFDGVAVSGLAVPAKDLREALLRADPHFVKILRQAASNIRKFHRRQLHASWKMQTGPELRQRYRPVERAGVYVPGGKAAYPSTVLMNVIPAQIAGVEEIILVSPPDRNGRVHRDVLAAAALLGVRSVFRVGGAQAIAALAYGTESIPPVDVIVGPGNIFVATAKRLVYGLVGTDGVAGPSEVVILADDTARPEFVAADMLAQSEHDESASAILVTPSLRLARLVKQALNDILPVLPRRAIIASSLKQHGAIYLVRNLTQGAALVNQLAPEHLEIITADDESTLRNIDHAGSIFLGNFSPVVAGDYLAGPNHVLPTGRTARFASPLSVDTFMKKSSIIRYSKPAMEKVGRAIAAFAEHEGLTAHALSARMRVKGGKK